MKIFYDSEGNIIGHFEGANAEVESKLTIDGMEEVTVPEDVRARIKDPKDSLTVFKLRLPDLGETKQKHNKKA